MKKNKEFTWNSSASVGNYSTNVGDAKIYTGVEFRRILGLRSADFDIEKYIYGLFKDMM